MPRKRLAEAGRSFLRRSGIHRAYITLRPPRWPGLRVTAKRLLNYHMAGYQRARGHTKLLGYPLVLTLEATNVCNLRCPHCFTGAGEVGRQRSMMPMPLFRRIIDELGDYALHLEFYNWGEPLLNKSIHEMIRIASDKGISTILSTNFSVPFDRARAEALVDSGLAILGFGLDGATQESYEKYRVGGDLELVLSNVRLLNEAKQAMRSPTPRVCWSLHVFDHNRHEVDQARGMASELGVDIDVTKGWVAGPEWDPAHDSQFPWQTMLVPDRCKYLWTYAIINNDGGVAPCSGTFFKEDDFGSVEDTSFKAVWNNEDFQNARRLFRSRDASDQAKGLICHGCPFEVVWHDYQRHLAGGHSKASFEAACNANDWFNHFFQRRHQRADTAEAGASDLTRR